MNALQFQKKLLSMQENMMNFALMLTANRDDAQDLMQDTTLKVLDNQEKFVDNPQIRNPTKVSERCGPNRQECDFSSLD